MSKQFPKFYVNTDTVDIQNKQIGISSGRDNREFSIGVNHLRTKESVKEATRIARLLAKAPVMLSLIKDLVDQPGQLHEDVCVMKRLIKEIEGRD